jgi:hypothetical protein
MSDNHTQSTIDWYVNWLAERRPDLSGEQILEMATGFTMLQQPPVQKPDPDDDVLPDGQTVGNLLAADRAEQRKRRRLTGKELAAIIGPEALDA